jgi:hypothetical protein
LLPVWLIVISAFNDQRIVTNWLFSETPKPHLSLPFYLIPLPLLPREKGGSDVSLIRLTKNRKTVNFIGTSHRIKPKLSPSHLGERLGRGKP